MRDIGKNIRLLRMKRNITQDELAEKLFVSRQTISNYETGRSRPDIDTLIRLSEILGADVQELLYGPSVPKRHIIEKCRLLFGICLCAIIAVFCIGIEHLIEYLGKAPGYLYLHSFQSGAFYSLWLIVRPCLFLVIGWTVMQGLSLLPKAKILQYDTKHPHKIIVTFLVTYFLIVGVFCGWMLIANWLSYQHRISDSVEGFRMSFSIPIITQCVRFFANHRKTFWAVFVPIGMFLWLTTGQNTDKRKNAIADEIKKDES